MLTVKANADPKDLQCGTEQLHALLAVTTEACEYNSSYVESDILLVLYRVQKTTFWLSNTCKSIDKNPLNKQIAGKVATALQRVESICKMALWQKEFIDKHIENMIEEIVEMAIECQTETKKLYC